MSQAVKSVWEDFKKNFPLKDLVAGFLIPKALLFAGIAYGAVPAGAAAAMLWSVTVVAVSRARRGRANIFAVLAMIAISARVVVVVAGRNPVLYIYAQAMESAIYGAAFLISLMFKRSLMQLFVEAANVRIPEEVKRSVYYRKAWNIVTAVWGGTYICTALIIVLFRMVSMKAAAAIDILSNWPVTIALILFTAAFPRIYWTRKRCIK